MSEKKEMSALDALLAQYNQNISPTTNENTGGIKYDEKNYFSASLADGEETKKYTIRILPPNAGQQTSFEEMWVHQIKVANGKKQTFTCIKKHKNEDCPFCEANQLLYKSNNEQEKDLAKNYFARKMFVVKLIDRNKEAEGPKFWRFPYDKSKQGVYDKIMGIITSINQDVTDKNTGRDLVLTIGRNQLKFPVVSSITQLDSSPVSKLPEQQEAWLSDARTWKDVYGIKTYEYLEIIVKGGVPVYNKELEKFVDKNATKDSDTTSSETTIGLDNALASSENTNKTQDDEDLPF